MKWCSSVSGCFGELLPLGRTFWVVARKLVFLRGLNLSSFNTGNNNSFFFLFFSLNSRRYFNSFSILLIKDIRQVKMQGYSECVG